MVREQRHHYEPSERPEIVAEASEKMVIRTRTRVCKHSTYLRREVGIAQRNEAIFRHLMLSVYKNQVRVVTLVACIKDGASFHLVSGPLLSGHLRQ
jgi:hypothetical protein